MNNRDKAQRLISKALVNNFKKVKHIDGLSGEEEYLALKEINKFDDPDVCPDCQSMTHLECEVRDGGYNEMVRYCYGCGTTQTA